MSKLPPLIALTLLIAATSAMSEEVGSEDLRYCLDLQSNYEIAKCAGEVSAGSKGKPYTREEVDMILSERQSSILINPSEPSDMPDTGNEVQDLLLDQSEGGGRKQ